MYLAAAGVGTLRVVDDDVVDRSNLQRQVLHTEARIGTSEGRIRRAAALAALNPRTHVDADRGAADAATTSSGIWPASMS